MKSIFIEAREWFDKSGGNSYWSAHIKVDGELVLVIPMTYGYDTAYLHESLQALHQAGHIPTFDLWNLRQTGFHIYHTKYSTTKNKMYKLEKESTCV